MGDSPSPTVIVGVEASGSRAALEYAVADASRRGCGLHLVHVSRPVLGSPGSGAELSLVGGEPPCAEGLVLASTAAVAERMLATRASEDGRLCVSTELAHGSVVATLQSMSTVASLVVLGHHGTGPIGETPTLSVAAGLAAVSRAPVVALPPGWRLPRTPRGRVVVGVEDPGLDTRVIDAARHEAERRGAVLAEVRAEGCGVVVDRLLDHARDADLVVVGSHHRRHAIGASLGRTSRALLERSPVPVMLVDPVRGDGSSDRTSASVCVRP
jgi:nucleotide-binding universal stress UspA family protein